MPKTISSLPSNIQKGRETPTYYDQEANPHQPSFSGLNQILSGICFSSFTMKGTIIPKATTMRTTSTVNLEWRSQTSAFHGLLAKNLLIFLSEYVFYIFSFMKHCYDCHSQRRKLQVQLKTVASDASANPGLSDVPGKAPSVHPNGFEWGIYQFDYVPFKPLFSLNKLSVSKT